MKHKTNKKEISNKFKVGDKVKITSLQSKRNRGDCEVGVGAAGVIIDIDEDSEPKYSVEFEHNYWWWEEENLELVEEEETMYEQTQNTYGVTPKTPYQGKGYTENSLFKFVGEDGQFDNGELIKLHYDDGDDCPDFKSISRDRKRYCCLFEVEYVGEEGVEDMIPDYEETIVKGITSDGGASDYYFTKLPQHIIDSIVITGGIEIKDIARYVYDNDADAFNIIKAEKRIIEERKGKGKLGNTALYDANKIKFFANEQYEAIKHTEEHHG